MLNDRVEIKNRHGEKMLKKILPILLAMTILLAACGPLTLPTMAPADALGTAVAATLTAIAATQVAIPTNTPPPPTETASPTPTVEPSIPSTVTMAADPNNCTKALNVGEAGLLKNVRVENENKSTVNLSLNLYKPNTFGQCGALSYSIKGGAKMNIQIPSGSWSAYSWVLDPPSTGNVSFIIGTSKSKDLLRLVIKKDVIAWVGP
jgi:hypothetical protein